MKSLDLAINLQMIQRIEEHVTMYHLHGNQQNPDCGKLYRINDQVSSINNCTKRERRETLF